MPKIQKSLAISSGLSHMILSCVFFSVMANLAYWAQLLEPNLSTISMSASRILINLVGILLITALHAKRLHCDRPLGDTLRLWWDELRGDGGSSLWLRGVFGSVAMIFYFAALRAIGAGESTFLQSSNSLFIAGLAPVILGQKNSPFVWAALGGAALGLFFLLEPRITDQDPLGRLFGIGSGLFSAAAYLMIAKAGQRNRPETVVFYFCLVGSLIHLGMLFFLPSNWPKNGLTWLILLGIGIFGTIAQIHLTEAYQKAPAALAGAVSYSQPVLNTLAAVIFFNHPMDFKSWLGASLVGGFGIVLPFLIHRGRNQDT